MQIFSCSLSQYEILGLENTFFMFFELFIWQSQQLNLCSQLCDIFLVHYFLFMSFAVKLLKYNQILNVTTLRKPVSFVFLGSCARNSEKHSLLFSSEPNIQCILSFVLHNLKKLEKTTLAGILSLLKDFVKAIRLFYHIYRHSVSASRCFDCPLCRVSPQKSPRNYSKSKNSNIKGIILLAP